MKIEPLSDNVFILEDKPKESTGNILLPDSAKEKPKTGTVYAVGPGRFLDNGVFKETRLSRGDRVIYSPFSGADLTVGEEKYLVMAEDSVIGKIIE